MGIRKTQAAGSDGIGEIHRWIPLIALHGYDQRTNQLLAFCRTCARNSPDRPALPAVGNSIALRPDLSEYGRRHHRSMIDLSLLMFNWLSSFRSGGKRTADGPDGLRHSIILHAS